MDPVLTALRETLERDPENAPLWTHYADLLLAAQQFDDARDALRRVLTIDATATTALLKLLPLLRKSGEVSEALIRAENWLEKSDDSHVRVELARSLAARGDRDAAFEHYRRALTGLDEETRKIVETELATGNDVEVDATAPASKEGSETPDSTPPVDKGPDRPSNEIDVAAESSDLNEWAAQFDWSDLHTTFKDVAGLEDVKKQIRLRIIAPLKQPEIYRAFRRQAGGGILLYGPPGCGKTFIARATAGECGARFICVGIHEVLDRYWGESEKMVHALFEEARRKSPTILFFDEFDAFGGTRGPQESQFWKTLVNQFLQEMDGVGGQNDQVLVFAATNLPWNVDAAFRRPGRFDRIFFVPPPDVAGRAAIVDTQVKKLPGGGDIHAGKLARQTALLTGADLVALCERAAEHALERSLETGDVHPVTMADFQRELKGIQSSALEWFATAKNYARFANEGGQYDDLADFLKRLKRW